MIECAGQGVSQVAIKGCFDIYNYHTLAWQRNFCLVLSYKKVDFQYFGLILCSSSIEFELKSA